VNEEEIIFNKLHNSFKNSVLNKKIPAVIDRVEFIDISKEKISELRNKPNSDLLYFNVGVK